MARAVWKGAISFGLVHVPVALYPASREVEVDFDWLDRRTMDPVGYKRVNKRTGKEIAREFVSRGVKLDGGDYVVLTDEEVKAALPKSTQLVDIEAFIKASEISFVLLERPFYLEPIAKGERVYALLREAMADAGVIAVARVVMHTKEHLAVLVPSGNALMLNTIRWASEIRSYDELKLPAAGKSGAGLKPAELKMARQLIAQMTGPWTPDEYTDKFSSVITALVKAKAAAGERHDVEPLEDAPESANGSNVVDLTALLAQSLGKRKVPVSQAARPQPASKTQSKTSAAKRTVRKRA